MSKENRQLHQKGQQQPLTNNEVDDEPLATYPMGWRHVVTFVAFIGFFTMYSLRVNMSVALVAMVNHTALAIIKNTTGDHGSICHAEITTTKAPITTTVSTIVDIPVLGNVTIDYQSADGKYEWTTETQGIILGSFFYGYIMTQFIGGVIAGKYGAKWVFGIGNVLTGVFTLLSPMAAEIGVGAFIFVRVMQGFTSGVTWPSMQAFFSRWAPPSERSTLPAIAYAGSFIGTPITFALSGLLASSGFLGGWPSVFYVWGILCLIWFGFWAVLSSSGPENHKFISREEQTYILKSLESGNYGAKKPGLRDVPWKKVVKSSAVWAVIVAHFTYNWSLYVLMTALPSYFKMVQGFDIKKNGAVSALPYIVQFIVHMTSGRLADVLRTKFNLKTVTVRKMFDCFGHLLPAIFVVSVGFVGCNHVAAVALLTMAIGCSGLCGAGWFVNFLDIAPQFAGILFGVSNTFSTIPGIVGPLVTGFLVRDNTMGGWRTVFFIIGTLYAFSSVFFAIFGQGSVQPWASSAKKTANILSPSNIEQEKLKESTKV